MRMSELFVRTLREDPTDADVASHRLLARAGYIRRIAPGIYSWLPLGLAALQRVEGIVREEMTQIGAQEVRLPALLPREPYEQTNRWHEYGDVLFRLQDRREDDYLLGPTHEEIFTLLVKDMYSSYKDLPLRLYQIQTKYRDESRPRAGILRGREFVMKDSYSFDLDQAALELSYQAHRRAYINIFDRLGLEYVIVHAQSGAMGGSASEEFLALSETGEDTFVRSPGGFAANVEAVDTPVMPAIDSSDAPQAHIESTPDTGTIETLVEHLNARFPRTDYAWTEADTLKNVLVMVHHSDGTREPLAIGLPGDRDLDMTRLEARIGPAEAVPFSDEDFAQWPQLAKGYIGPGALGERNGIRYLLDPRIVEGSRWVTGADKPDHHVLDLVAGRDFSGDGTIDAAEVREGDPSPDGSGPLSLARGIEMGHIFQLGTKYAEALGLQVLDPHGKLVTVTMGSYGVGVSRAVAAVVERFHDELGIVWPREVAPFDIHLVATGKDDAAFDTAEDIYGQLTRQGKRVLYDDRPKVSPGVKFKDAELLGMPTIVIIGRNLADGVIEVRDRATGHRQDIASDDIVEYLVAI